MREILSGPSNAASDGARPGKRIPALTLAFLVIIGAAAVWFGGRSRTLPVRGAAPIRSLAVLPLIDLSPDQRQEYFAEAMTEELTTRLAKLGNWRVTSRTSVMSYRGTEKRVPEIATELGVDAVVEGSVIRDGSRVKITAQLIDGKSDRHIWADSYERELAGVLAIQNDVARAIAREVDVRLTPEGNARLLAATRSVLPAVYYVYVRGRHAWDKRGEADPHEAIRFFQESIDADPTYAPAYAGMADCYGQLGYAVMVSSRRCLSSCACGGQESART